MTHKTEPMKQKLTENLTLYINKKYKTITKKAFTLLELLVVILILGLLASTVVPAILGSSEDAKRDLVCINMKGAANALKMFKLHNGMYPETEEGFSALQANPDTDKYPNYATSAYLEKLPKDSWGRKMVYLKTGNSFEIISYAADQKEGGTDENADIKYSNCK